MAWIILIKIYKTYYKDKLHYKLHYKLTTNKLPIKMATTLIDTRKPIMAQITHSWNQFRTTDDAIMFTDFDKFEIPFAKDFAEKDAPWSSKQTVLERNAVHANKLIRLYIALNIETAERMHIWQFFEIGNGIVGKIKEKTKLLKRVQKVLKKQQEYGMDLSNATDLYLYRNDVNLYTIEVELKEYPEKMKMIKEQKKRNAALRRAKKEQKRKDAEKKKKEEKKVENWIEALITATPKKAKRDMLKLWKAMERDGYTIRDVIEELERQLD